MHTFKIIIASFFLFQTAFAAELKGKSEEIAVFAGGCFWCMEPPFEKLDGVSSVVSGYSGGEVKNPTYEQVSSGSTKHREAVKVTFDPTKISYEKIVEVFWKNVNPTDDGGQFVDRGFQYTPAIYYTSDNQKKIAEQSKAKHEKSGIFKDPIKTPIEEFKNFYDAEKYHQDYYKNNPVRYKYYRYRSGRDEYLDKIWKK